MKLCNFIADMLTIESDPRMIKLRELWPNLEVEEIKFHDEDRGFNGFGLPIGPRSCGCAVLQVDKRDASEPNL